MTADTATHPNACFHGAPDWSTCLACARIYRPITADTELRPIDYNGHLPTDPPEYQHPDDDEDYWRTAADYFPPDSEPPF